MADAAPIKVLCTNAIKEAYLVLVPQFERAFGEKVAAESRAAIDPKLQAMTQAVGLKLRAASIAP